MAYDHHEIDKKWQRYWAEHNEFNTTTDPKKPNYYALDMFLSVRPRPACWASRRVYGN